MGRAVLTDVINIAETDSKHVLMLVPQLVPPVGLFLLMAITLGIYVFIIALPSSTPSVSGR